MTSKLSDKSLQELTEEIGNLYVVLEVAKDNDSNFFIRSKIIMLQNQKIINSLQYLEQGV